jgi:hypothetical protein
MPAATHRKKRYNENVSRNNDFEEVIKEIDMKTASVTGVPASVAADIEELLGDLDLDGELLADSDSIIEDLEEDIETEVDEIEAVAEEVAEPDAIEEIDAATEEDLDEALSDSLDIDDLDLAIAKVEAHAGQESDTSIEDAPVKTEAAAKPERKKREPGTAPVRSVKALADLEPETFILEDGDYSPEELAQNKIDVIAAKPEIKKVGEKYENLFQSLGRNALPSVYVVAAFKLIDDKKTVTATDVKAMFKASGHTDGTAQSQAGQIMALFDALRIAKRAKNTLTMNDNSIVAGKLRKIIADAKAA